MEHYRADVLHATTAETELGTDDAAGQFRFAKNDSEKWNPYSATIRSITDCSTSLKNCTP
jgi:hypothetical protein